MKYGTRLKIYLKNNSEPVYNDKYIEAKINLYDTNFFGNKTLIEDEHCPFFSVIFLDSIVNVDKKQIKKNIITNIFKRMEVCSKTEKNNNTINEELKLDESDDDEC